MDIKVTLLIDTNWLHIYNIFCAAHSLNEVAIAQMIGGHHAEPRRKKYIRCDDRICDVVRDYESRNTLDYLRAIAYNLTC